MGKTVILSNETIEYAVIGTILRHSECYIQSRDVLNPDMFHDENRQIFIAIKEVFESGNIATPITVTACLNDKGINGNRIELQRMVAYSDTDTFQMNVRKLDEYYKRSLARAYFQQFADEAVKMGNSLDEIIDRSVKELKGLTSVSSADSVVSASEAMQRMKQHVLDVRDGKISPGIKTGFRIFDVNYGLHDDDLVVIAARTGVGKSALAMNMAINIAKNGIGVAYFSSEMGLLQLWARVISYDMKMRPLDILNMKMSDEELNRLALVTDNYSKYPLRIDEEACADFDRIIRSIRTMHQQFDTKVFVVDYLQIVRTTKNFDSETQRLAYISRELKNIAKELHVAVVLLSQMNRGGAREGYISKFLLRGSGEIEEAADSIVLIERPDADPNTRGKKFTGVFDWVQDTTNKALFILHKGRSTGDSEFLENFIPEYTLFTDYGQDEINTEYSGAVMVENDPLPPMQSDLPF